MAKETRGRRHISPEELYYHKIDKLIKDKQLFLQPEVGVNELAKELGTNRTYISNAICAKHRNFRKYLNSIRVDYLLSQMVNGDISESVLMDSEEVAFSAGFTNRKAMDRILRNEFGKTFCQLRNEYICHAKKI